MYFLVSGSARTEIKMNLVSRQKIPLGLKKDDHEVTKENTKVLTGHLDHLPGAVFGDCSSLLGFTREEALVTDEDCVFLSLDANYLKKSVTPMECELLVRFLTKKMQRLRQRYSSFLATKHTESLRIAKILGSTYRSSIKNIKPGGSERKSRLENIFNFMAKSLVNKMGLKVHNESPTSKFANPADQLASISPSHQARLGREPTHRFSRKQTSPKPPPLQIPLLTQSMVNIAENMRDLSSSSPEKTNYVSIASMN